MHWGDAMKPWTRSGSRPRSGASSSVASPHSPEHDRCWAVVSVSCGRSCARPASSDEAAENLREQERLWPGDAKQLEEIAKDWQKQADSVGQGCDELTPEERSQRDGYLVESRRVATFAGR